MSESGPHGWASFCRGVGFSQSSGPPGERKQTFLLTVACPELLVRSRRVLTCLGQCGIKFSHLQAPRTRSCPGVRGQCSEMGSFALSASFFWDLGSVPFADASGTNNIFSSQRLREIVVYKNAGFLGPHSIKCKEIITILKQLY